MATLTITVPVELSKNEHGTLLRVSAPNGNQAGLYLEQLDQPALRSIFVAWAEDELLKAMKSRRRCTGLRDRSGQVLYEGDIVTIPHGRYAGMVPAVVKWCESKAAFVFAVQLPDGGGFSTSNLGQAASTVVIGNLLENPEKLQA